MKIGAKIIAILSSVLAGYVLVHFLVQHFIMLRSFQDLEDYIHLKNVNRCVAAFEREGQHLVVFVKDWSFWDDTYRFVHDANQDYVDANLSSATFSENSLNIIAYFNESGKLVWGQHWGENGSLLPFPDSAALLAGLPSDRPSSDFSGIVLLGAGHPLLFAVAPILKTDLSGPARGLVLMGRYVSDAYVASLAKQVNVDFDMLGFHDHEPNAKEREIAHGGKTLLLNVDDRTTHGYAVLPVINREPGLLLKAVLNRDVSNRGRDALRFSFYSILIAGIVLLCVLVVLLRRVVLDPIEKLSAVCGKIAASGDLDRVLPGKGNDEIAHLAGSFNTMIDELRAARTRLAAESYRAGLAEMAAGTLHNVGNILTPLVVSLDNHAGRGIATDRFRQAVRELQAGDIPEERRKDLCRFLELTVQQVADFSEGLRDRKQKLQAQLRLIGEMLAAHGRLAGAAEGRSACDLENLFEDALAGIDQELLAKAEVRFSDAVARINGIVIPRLVVLHVLVNILVNALESIVRAGRPGRIEIDASRRENRVLLVTIADNGAGISPEDLPQVFSRSFSTKRTASTGVGLHWCANAISAMGGGIKIDSPGPGEGAVVHLEVPCDSP